MVFKATPKAKGPRCDALKVKKYAQGKADESGDMSDEMMLGMMQTTKLEKQRCIYEDENILVEHSFATFGSGTKEAVLAVHTKKDGLIWQTETGATPI